MQRYLHITESQAYVLKMFAIMFLLLINFLISLEICSIPKESKYMTVLLFTYNAIHGVPILEYSSRITTFAPFFILSGRLSLL